MLNVKQFREERSVSQPMVVSVLREQFSGMDKPLLSKVENPDKYGVRLVNEAERLLEEAFTRTAPETRKRDNRRLPVKVQCRLSKTQFAALQQALKRDGFDTVQGGLSALIARYIDEQKQAL